LGGDFDAAAFRQSEICKIDRAVPVQVNAAAPIGLDAAGL
jgi:hypothetical protein